MGNRLFRISLNNRYSALPVEYTRSSGSDDERKMSDLKRTKKLKRKRNEQKNVTDADVQKNRKDSTDTEDVKKGRSEVVQRRSTTRGSGNIGNVTESKCEMASAIIEETI